MDDYREPHLLTAIVGAVPFSIDRSIER
ncbi:hypothetical protein VTL71DRAFT_9255 [Oculimacula yallundae]|uniref:Uncharacterized protein n=1 Tax=Oculimacula yallundae TaxID=86028 RepID=A0ABR4BSI2_9HELO